MKKEIFAALLLFAALSLPAQDRAVIDKVAATVGGEILLLSEVQEQLTYAKQQQPSLPPDFHCEAMQNLIIQKLLVNQAKIDSVEVKDEEVENQLGARIDRLLLYFNQDPKAIEEYYGQGIEQIKEQMRNDMRNQLLAERMQAEITGKATITPSEVQKFYSSIPADSLPFFNAEVEIREIVYQPQVSAEEKAKAMARIEELRRRILEGGEDFAELAKKYSDDSGSATSGGDLGWQKRGTFVAAFEAMVYKLDQGQISPVVETEFGYHIIQRLDRRGNLVKARHILIKPEITAADLDRAKAKMDSVRQLINDQKTTFGAAVKLFGKEDVPSYNNDGRVANPRTGNTFFEVADLDTDVFFAIEKLEPGDVTQPISFRGPDGTRYFRLVQLVSRSKPHRADLKQDYNKIQAAALEQKKAGYVDQWMREKLRSTYLAIDPLFRDCPDLQALLQEADDPNRP